MKNMQLLRDYGRMLNDGRIATVDGKATADGWQIGKVIFEQPNSYITLKRDVFLTRDNLIDTVRAVYAWHPTRAMTDVLYSLRYDLKRKAYSLAVTNSANLELFGVKHTRTSYALGRALYDAIVRGDGVLVRASYCDGFISHGDKSGGYLFSLT